MEKDKIFFAEQGLTTTSANYVANLAKESYQALERELALVKFYSLKVGLLGSNDAKALRQGVSNTFLKTLEVKLKEIASYKSLIAWLREAIKAKERLIKEAQELSNGEITDILGIEYVCSPNRYERLTSDDVVGSWNIKQRNRYYYLDTVCSVIGSYIHPDGTFARQRNELLEVLVENHKVEGSGRDMVIYTKTPSVNPSLVEDTFFALQNSYREFQAELNSMKHSIETTLQEDDRTKSLKEQEEYNQYSVKYAKMCKQCEIYKNEAIAKAQALKITIPDSLKAVYSKVQSKGK